MASNIHGNKNEKDLQNTLHKKYMYELNDNLKSFIEFIGEKENLVIDDNTKIFVEKVGGNYKADINLCIGNNVYGVSVKTGSGNSVHQEKSSSFIDFIRNELNASDRICNNFIWFIDSIEDSRTLKNNFPDRIDELRRFLDSNKNILAIRFLKTGLNEKFFADYIYYGTPEKGMWGKIDDIIRFIEVQESSKRATLKLGPLNLQAWNRTNEDKRYTLQVKWTSVQKDLTLLYLSKHKE